MTMPTLSGTLTSLSTLLRAEEEWSQRVRVSKLGWWVDVRRVRGSAIGRIWRAVLGVTLWSTLVVAAGLYYGKALGLSNNVTPLLAVVVGLLLVFRNSTAYTRWDEGRKAFGNLSSIVRSLSRSVWINVGAMTPTAGRLASDGTLKLVEDTPVTDQQLKAKTQAIRLMVAFVIATKHHVRREYGPDYEDLRALLPAKFIEAARTTGYGYGAADADALSCDGYVPHHHRDNERTPFARSHPTDDSIVILHNELSKPSLPLPLIIAHQLGLLFAVWKRQGLLESIGPAGYNALSASLASLVDNFTAIERLASIGIPTVYGIHLKQCVSLYLFTLPFTLVEVIGWKTIPFVSVCAFTLIGIEGIASEIEMPFGVDDSDLPLDLIGAELRNEVEHMISKLSTHIDDWMM